MQIGWHSKVSNRSIGRSVFLPRPIFSVSHIPEHKYYETDCDTKEGIYVQICHQKAVFSEFIGLLHQSLLRLCIRRRILLLLLLFCLLLLLLFCLLLLLLLLVLLCLLTHKIAITIPFSNSSGTIAD